MPGKDYPLICQLMILTIFIHWTLDTDVHWGPLLLADGKNGPHMSSFGPLTLKGGPLLSADGKNDLHLSSFGPLTLKRVPLLLADGKRLWSGLLRMANIALVVIVWTLDAEGRLSADGKNDLHLPSLSADPCWGDLPVKKQKKQKLYSEVRWLELSSQWNLRAYLNPQIIKASV